MVFFIYFFSEFVTFKKSDGLPLLIAKFDKPSASMRDVSKNPIHDNRFYYTNIIHFRFTLLTTQIKVERAS